MKWFHDRAEASTGDFEIICVFIANFSLVRSAGKMPAALGRGPPAPHLLVLSRILFAECDGWALNGRAEYDRAERERKLFNKSTDIFIAHA
jgi:hypothetical protein